MKTNPFDLGTETPMLPVATTILRPVLIGVTAIAVAVGGFGVWAATAPLASAVIAQGKLAVAGQRKQIQHLEGGIVQRIAVREGQRVSKGEVLAELDVTRARSRYTTARQGFMTQSAVLARFKSERDNAARVVYPDALLAEAAKDPEVAALLDGQQQLFDFRRSDFGKQQDILEERIRRLGDDIAGKQSEYEALQQQVVLVGEEHKLMSDLFERKLTTRQRVIGLKRELTNLKGNIGQAKSRIASMNKEIKETEFALAQARSQRGGEILEGLETARKQMLGYHQELETLRNELERTAIRAPLDGTIVGLRMHSVNGVIHGGDTLMEIVPDDQLTVEVQVRPTDIDNVRIGQPTKVRFVAFNQRTTPTLSGRVVNVSADALSDARSPESYYRAEIEVDSAELAKLGIDNLHPGMPCEVMIEAGERTAVAYLMEPFAVSLDRAWREP